MQHAKKGKLLGGQILLPNFSAKLAGKVCQELATLAFMVN
jgi:hypothetical protein